MFAQQVPDAAGPESNQHVSKGNIGLKQRTVNTNFSFLKAELLNRMHIFNGKYKTFLNVHALIDHILKSPLLPRNNLNNRQNIFILCYKPILQSIRLVSITENQSPVRSISSDIVNTSANAATHSVSSANAAHKPERGRKKTRRKRSHKSGDEKTRTTVLSVLKRLGLEELYPLFVQEEVDIQVNIFDYKSSNACA